VTEGESGCGPGTTKLEVPLLLEKIAQAVARKCKDSKRSLNIKLLFNVNDKNVIAIIGLCYIKYSILKYNEKNVSH
jgi:hypothetical protein